MRGSRTVREGGKEGGRKERRGGMERGRLKYPQQGPQSEFLSVL